MKDVSQLRAMQLRRVGMLLLFLQEGLPSCGADTANRAAESRGSWSGALGSSLLAGQARVRWKPGSRRLGVRFQSGF